MAWGPRRTSLLHIIFEFLQVDVDQLPQLRQLLPELLSGDVVGVDMCLRGPNGRKALFVFDLIYTVINRDGCDVLATAENDISAKRTHDVA